jgi:hypothetical protein
MFLKEITAIDDIFQPVLKSRGSQMISALNAHLASDHILAPYLGIALMLQGLL